MRLPGNLHDGLRVRLIISLVITGAIVLPLLLLGGAQAHQLDVKCQPSEVQQGNELVCEAVLVIPDPQNPEVSQLQVAIAGPTHVQATFNLSGGVIDKDAAVQSVELIRIVPIGNGYGYDGNGYGYDGFPYASPPPFNGYGYDNGYGYGYGFLSLKYVYRITIDTSGMDDGDYLARFILFPTDPDADPVESEPDAFTVVPVEPKLEQILVTLSEIEVNKKKTGAGSPWVIIVPAGNPITVDLLAVAKGDIEGLLGDALAEPGIYKIIRMHIEDVKLKFTGQPLVSAKPTPPKIQLGQSDCLTPDGEHTPVAGCFEVKPGQVTKLRLDVDTARSLTEKGDGSFNFSTNHIILTVLTEAATTSSNDAASIPVRGSSGNVLASPLAEDDGVIELSISDPSLAAGLPAQLAFVQQPGNARASAPFDIQPAVEILDSLGNRATGDSSTQVTMAISGGTGTAGAVLAGTVTSTAVEGLVTFTDLSIDLAGPDYVLIATAPDLAAAFSQPFGVAAPLGTASGVALLEGRGPAHNENIFVVLFRDGTEVDSSVTTPSGAFGFDNLEPGSYYVEARHLGWLSASKDFDINSDVDLGVLLLYAGDADANGQIDSHDMQLFQRGLNRPPRAGVYADVDDDGAVTLEDMTYAARNLGMGIPEPATIQFFGPRAQPTTFGVPIGNLPVVGVNKTQGTMASDRDGPVEPFLGSIAYLKLSSPKPTVAPYTMTSTHHSGFPSLGGLGPEQLSYDFTGSNMLAGNVLDRRGDAPMSLDDPLFDVLDNVVYFIEDGTARGMEKRTYVGGTWTMLENGGTPEDDLDDSVVAIGTVEFITLFLDYSAFENTGHGLVTVLPGSDLYADLTTMYGTDKLEMFIHALQSPVFQDDPPPLGTRIPGGYAVFESDIELEPAPPP